MAGEAAAEIVPEGGIFTIDIAAFLTAGEKSPVSIQNQPSGHIIRSGPDSGRMVVLGNAALNHSPSAHIIADDLLVQKDEFAVSLHHRCERILLTKEIIARYLEIIQAR